jgi:hypothetical protein
MITNGILLVLQGVINVILLPLSALNVVIDVASSIPVVGQFLQVVAYIVPWSNLLPLFIIAIAIFLFRTTLAVVKLIVEFLPFF